VRDLPFFLHILRDGRGLCPEGSATLCRHEHRSIEPTTMSGCVDELHPKYSGRFHGDVTTVIAGFGDVIYVLLVKITSPRNLRVIYGVNRNLGMGQNRSKSAVQPSCTAVTKKTAGFPRLYPLRLSRRSSKYQVRRRKTQQPLGFSWLLLHWLC